MADRLDHPQLDDTARQQPQRPVRVALRPRLQSQGDDLRLLFAVEPLQAGGNARPVGRTCIRACCGPNAKAWRVSWRISGANCEEYQALKQGGVSTITIDSFNELGVGLIKARIAAGLSPKALAKRVGVKE